MLVRRDQSDSDGIFTLHSVVAGQYTVVAISDGWDLEWAAVSKQQAGLLLVAMAAWLTFPAQTRYTSMVCLY